MYLESPDVVEDDIDINASCQLGQELNGIRNDAGHVCCLLLTDTSLCVHVKQMPGNQRQEPFLHMEACESTRNGETLPSVRRSRGQATAIHKKNIKTPVDKCKQKLSSGIPE